MKKRRINFSILTILAIIPVLLLLVSCNKKEKIEEPELTQRTTLASKSSNYSYSLSSAISHHMGFTGLKLDKNLFDYSDGIYYPNAIIEDLEEVFCQEFQFDHEESFTVFIPVYSSSEKAYIYTVRYFCTAGQGGGHFNIESISYAFFKTQEGFCFPKSTHELENALIMIAAGNDDYEYGHIQTDYENSEYFNYKEITECEIQFDHEINLNDLECSVFYEIDDYHARLDSYESSNIPDFVDYVIDGISCTGVYSAEDSPILNYPSFEVDVDNPPSLDEIKSKITATDATEGNISSKIQIKNNNYILDQDGKIKIGNYSFTAYVEDMAGNRTEEKVIVRVVDRKAPTIQLIGNETIRTRYNEKLTEEGLRELFNYSDNYYQKEDLEFTISMSNYNENYSKLGTYQITASVKDPSNNVQSKDVKVEVYDDIVPIITIPSSLSKIKNNSPIINELSDYLKQKITVYDGYDGRIEFEITDYNNIFTKNSVGEYRIGVSAHDSSNNNASQDFNIEIVDADTPIIKFDTDYFIYVPKTEYLTETMIESIFTANKEIIDNIKIEKIESEYYDSNNYSKVGTYDLKITLNDGRTLNNKIVVQETEVKETFHFKDLFTKKYWSKLFNDFSKGDNWKHIRKWNWLMWVVVIFGGVVVIATVANVIRFKGKKRG